MNRWIPRLRAGLGLLLLLFTVVFVARTWHWPLVGDAPLMHYVVFLIHHGEMPYRDIVDINLPGTYALEATVMHLFGGGSLAWRIYDLLLCGAIAAAMIAIALPWDALAGLFAGALFLLLHGRDGLIDLGQRDLEITAMQLVACAVLFRTMRSGKPRAWAFAIFGLLFGAAATIKPIPLALGFALLTMAAWALRRRGHGWMPAFAAGTGALLLPWLIALAWLGRQHALHAFAVILFQLIPEHAGLLRRPAGYLLATAISSAMLPLVLLWLPIAVVQKRWRSWEGAALFVGIFFGLLSYYTQGKGYPYHRYPSESLLLLLIGLDLTAALTAALRGTLRSGKLAALSALALSYGVLFVGGKSLWKAMHYDWRNQEFDTMLRADLTHLGGAGLNHNVQCLDVASGCLNALYRMKLVQSTGFLYDCYLYAPDQNAAGLAYRRRFMEEMREHPPEVIVETSHVCGPGGNPYLYENTRGWPQFDVLLSTRYVLYTDRIPPDRLLWGGSGKQPFGYRIYVRREAPAAFPWRPATAIR